MVYFISSVNFVHTVDTQMSIETFVSTPSFQFLAETMVAKRLALIDLIAFLIHFFQTFC